MLACVGTVLMKGKFRKILLLCIVTSIGALSFFAYMSYKIKHAIPVSFESVEVTGDGGVRINKVSYSGTREGRTAWELEAESATHYKAKDLTLLEDVRLILYSKNGDTLHLISDRGRYNGKTELIEAIGNVVVESKDGYLLVTEKLDFLNGSGEVSTTADVKITTDMMVIEGKGLIMEIESGKMMILDNVRAKVTDASSL